MSYMVDGYHREAVAAFAPVNERVAFIRRTYAHVFGAIVAFVGLEALLLSSGIGQDIVRQLFVQKGAWLALMVLFVGGGYAAQYMARSSKSIGVQYMGLAMYVLLEVIIFLPILTIALDAPQFAGQHLPLKAGGITLLVFGGLTAAVFISKKDFSFMGPMLSVLSLLALGLVFFAVLGPVVGLGGLSLGLWFSVAMIALAAGFIIYDTSNIIHQYGTNQHVAASLSLFASVALMFYYVLRLLMSFGRSD